MMDYELTEGQIRVSEDGVLQVIDHDDVKVFEIDLVSKYPGDMITWSSGGKIGVDMFASDRTLDADCNASPTSFSLPLDSMNWILVAEGSRYTVRVIAYRVER